MSRYDDIINLPHHVSKIRKPMPMINRAYIHLFYS